MIVRLPAHAFRPAAKNVTALQLNPLDIHFYVVG